MQNPRFQVIATFVLLAPAAWTQQAVTTEPVTTQAVTIAAGVPLHIRITRTAALRTGQEVEGIVTEAIYVTDRLVVPKDAVVRGRVIAYAPVERKVRTQALLNGDVTPLHEPVVDFTTLRFIGQSTDVTMASHALIRNSQVVRFVPVTGRPSIRQQVSTLVRERIQSTREQIFSPGKKDRVLRLFYGQLPYHPQRIWAGTQFIADLDAPVTVELPAQPDSLVAPEGSLDGVLVKARLASTLDSASAKKNDSVTAIVTEPVFDAKHNLLVAEGAELEGTITQSKSARSFGRNGELRFAFRGVKADGGEIQKAYGTVRAAEGNASQNITVDDEGNVKANPDKNRFVAPLLLAATAMAGHDEDGGRHGGGGGGNLGGMTVASNGFGIIARVVALTARNQNVSLAFGAYGFAKSVYFRFLTTGNQVKFPKDTEVEVQLSVR